MGKGRTLSPVFCGGCVPFLEAAGGFDEPWGVSLEILSTSVEVKVTRPAQNRDLFSRDANQQDEMMIFRDAVEKVTVVSVLLQCR